MWHEARKREKATQKLFKDHKKRAEKRREENRVDPNSLLQINGLKSELHIDPSIYKQAGKSLVPWQGDSSVTIDRFDVRATLSSIPTADSITGKAAALDKNRREKISKRDVTVIDAEESEPMKKLLNYERYRLLIQNDLNKTTEELRLKIVAKSDFSSDAKMGKLRNNKFGTSGEASMFVSSNLVNPHYGNKISRMESHCSRKNATIGPSYNSVPPPSSLDSKSNNNIVERDNFNNAEESSNNMRILDLDEFDNFELDNMDHILRQNLDEKKLTDAAKKFGLSYEELMFMIERDNKDVGSSGTVKELVKLTRRCEKREVISLKDQVYGPALPPELTKVDESSNSSGDSSTQIQQRSPSGAEIPLRRRSNHEASSPEVEKSLESKNCELAEVVEAETEPKKESSNKFGGVDDKDSELKDNAVELEAKDVPRRASTPLAYKRNCRSDRSLSRERRNSRRCSSDRKRRRRRSRSSSYTSFTSSSQSSDNNSERVSRRKRLARSRRRRH